jgi:hypothetical protein
MSTAFTPCAKGARCELHLLAESRWHMYSTDLGYCGSRAVWWFGPYRLCERHKAGLERLLQTKGER